MCRTEPSRRREPLWRLAPFIAVALLAAGCSSIGSSIPHAVGGLPEGAPARSDNAPAFPQVHDLPPKRADAILSVAERNKLQADLAAARDGAAQRAAEAEAQTDDGKPKAQAKAAPKPKPGAKAAEKVEAQAR